MKTLMKNATMIVALLKMTSLSARADEAKNETPKAALDKTTHMNKNTTDMIEDSMPLLYEVVAAEVEPEKWPVAMVCPPSSPRLGSWVAACWQGPSAA
jgi:hypothetical protein